MEVPVCGVGGGAVGAGVYIDGESTWEAAGENKTYGWMDMHVGTGKPIEYHHDSIGREDRIEIGSSREGRAGQRARSRSRGPEVRARRRRDFSSPRMHQVSPASFEFFVF